LAGSFFSVFVKNADFTQALAQFDGPATQFQGGPQTLYGPLRGLVFHEEVGVEQSRFDLIEVFGL
jgi:hypothetical protein